MKASLFLLPLLLLARGLQGQCSLGCLSCKKTSPVAFECSVCDLHNNYTLNEEMKCVQSPIDGCELPSADHKKTLCLRCRAGYVLDQSQGKCVQVSEFHQVEHCESYLSLNHCQDCGADHVIQNGQCVALGDKKIADCVSYSADLSNCLACGPSKFLKGNACESIEAVANCSLYSQTICDQCQTGFLHERNYYSSAQMDVALAHEFIMNSNDNAGRVVPPPATVCIKQDIENCKTYVNFSFCGECVTGYYLDPERNCAENPDNVIPHCEKYSNATTCAECDDDYFLSVNECMPRTKVDDCERYEVTSSTCLECSWDHYLDPTNNKCLDRVMSKHIEYCEERAVSKDECARCRDRFLATTDRLACRYHVPDCNTYVTPTNFNTKELLCKICNHGLYPDGDQTSCLPQDVVNCQKYQPNSNVCTDCNNGFFLENSSGLCKPRTAMNCETFVDGEDKCETCAPGFYLTDPHCKAYTIRNCETPKPDADECETCFEHHFKADNDCFAYNVVGCVEFKPDQNHCTKCHSGYYLKNDTCLKHNLLDCEVASPTSNACTKCASGFILDSGLCSKIYVPHCDEADAAVDKCKPGKCQQGFWRDAQGQCLKVVQPNCKTIDESNGNCSVCEDGYYQETTGTTTCLQQYRPFCKDYVANKNDCSACEDGYYLLDAACYEENMPGCKEFKEATPTNVNECEKCSEGYFLNGTKCERYSVGLCDVFEAAADECKTCFDGFTLHPVTKTCYIPDAPNCTEVEESGNEVVCKTCAEGFGLNLKKQCEPFQNDENCLQPSDFRENIDANFSSGSMVTSRPFFECAVCAFGYFPDTTAEGGCKAFDAATANCLVQKFNEDGCAICKNGYTNASGTCTANSGNNCAINDGIAATCLGCLPGYFLDTTCKPNTGGTATMDDLCIANEGSTRYACTLCKKNHSLYEGDSTKELIYIPNCVLWASDDCSQCAEGYSLNTTTTPNSCDKHSDPSTMKCLQKVASDITPLTDATKCVKCPNYHDYYLSTGTCTVRTKKFVDNCDSYSSTDNFCNACKIGYESVGPSTTQAVCVYSNVDGTSSRKTKTDLAGLANCELLSIEQTAGTNFGQTTCMTCKPNYNINNGTCVLTYPEANLIDNLFFDPTLWRFTSKGLKTSPLANASVIGRSMDEVEYMKCDEGYVAVLATLALTSGTAHFLKGTVTDHNYYDKLTDKFTLFAHEKTIQECIKISSLSTYKIAHGTTASSTTSEIDPYLENCLQGLHSKGTIPDYEYVFCMKCKENYNPLIVDYQTDLVGAGTTVTSVICRETTNLFEKKYEFYNNDSNYKLIGLMDLLNFDSCANGEILVANMFFSNNIVWKLKGGVPFHPGLQCVDSISSTIEVANCQFYFVDPNNDPTTTTQITDKCGACKPGYYPKFSGPIIDSCNLIANCDLSDPSKNTWMNACQTCKKNFGYGMSAGTITYSKCFSLDDKSGKQVENCFIFGPSRCIFCNKGYEYNAYDYQCVPINKGRNGCVKYGHALPEIYTISTSAQLTANNIGAANSWTTNKMYFYALLHYLYGDNQSTKVFGCSECSGDVIPSAFTTATSFNACLETPNTSTPDFKASDILENCLKFIYNPSGAHACAECVEGFMFETSTQKCVDSSKSSLYENCLSGTTTGCATCHDGYVLFTDTCFKKNNCKTFKTMANTGRQCSECEQGYMPYKNGTLDDCVEAPADDPCSKWTYEMLCVQCYNGHTPITIKTGKDKYYAKCLEKAWKKNDTTTDHALINYPWQISLTSTGYEFTQDWQTIATGEFYVKTITDGNNQNCLPTFTIENCAIYGKTNECLKCKRGFIPVDGLTCQKGTVEGCAEYTMFGKCAQCDSGYYLTHKARTTTGTGPTTVVTAQGYNECAARTVTGCLEYRLDADECLVCRRGEYLFYDSNTSKTECKVHDDINCAFYEPNTKFCKMCLPGYTWNANSICTLVNNPGCMLQFSFSRQCMRCLPGFYLDRADGICKRYSFAGCRVPKPAADECTECEPEYFIKVTSNKYTTCELRKNKGCLVANPAADECYSCQPGMYLKSNACTTYTVQNCSFFHASADQCVDCLEGYFLNSEKKCLADADPNCRVVGKYNQRCLVCKEGTYYDSTTSKCKQSTKTCATFNPHTDECFTCEPGLWNDKGSCKRRTAINCLAHMPTADRCASCGAGYYLAGDGNCLLSTDPNCQIHKNYADQCVRCYSGYYIDRTERCSPYSVGHCRFYIPLKDACLSCMTGYYLDDSMNCQPITQQHCLGFVANSNKCANCQPGYYFANGVCGAYTIENCVHRDPFADNCLQCADGAYKFKNECRLYKAEHCKTFETHRDECASCENDRYLSMGACHEYTIEHCEKFHPEADMCEECKAGDHYRNGLGKCQDVTEVEHCETYHKFFDRCIACKDGHYLEDDKCLPNPAGVYKCKVYATELLCAICEAPYFLRENQCLMSSTIIPLCAYYTFDGNCGECEGNAFLISNQCHAVTNTTCLENSSPENCSKCEANKVLNTAGSTVICEDSGIADCIEAQYSTEPIMIPNSDPPTPAAVTNLCLKCAPGFFLKDNTCTATSTIADCSEYESEDVCAKCKTNFILSRDKKTCSDIASLAGANCAVARNTEAPECIACQEGYFFDSTGTCTECKVAGCAICDVINLRKCRLCKSGYQMTELFYCETISTIESNQPQVNRVVSDSGLGNDNSESVLGFRGVLMLLVILVIGNLDN